MTNIKISELDSFRPNYPRVHWFVLLFKWFSSFFLDNHHHAHFAPSSVSFFEILSRIMLQEHNPGALCGYYSKSNIRSTVLKTQFQERIYYMLLEPGSLSISEHSRHAPLAPGACLTYVPEHCAYKFAPESIFLRILQQIIHAPWAHALGSIN